MEGYRNQKTLDEYLAVLATKKPCEHCNRPLVRKILPSGRKELLSSFAKRKTCNLQCSALKRTKSKPTKLCTECKNLFPRNVQPSGRLEMTRDYNVRKTCGKECARARTSRLAKERAARELEYQELNGSKISDDWAHSVTCHADKDSLPPGSQFKNDLGIFKKVGGRLFRHDNDEWIYKPTMNGMRFSKEDYVKGKGL